MDAELNGIWLALSRDEAVWQGITAGLEQRLEILRLLAAGHPAVALDSLQTGKIQVDGADQGGAFRTREINGRLHLLPQKYERMLDFFLRRKPGTVGKTESQEDALAHMHSGLHLLLTGGPGTGKSFVLQQFLNEKSRATGSPRPLRIMIAAPTGKAAARYLQTMGGPGAIVESSTIHRVLGISQDRARPRHDSRNPVACDVLIVDEISMVDLGLFAALVSALPDHTQLIIAGDLNQLPAIDGVPIDATINLLARESLLAHTALSSVRRFSADKAAAYAAIAARGIAAVTNDVSGISLRDLPRRHLKTFLSDYASNRFCTADAAALRAALQTCFRNPAAAGETVTAALQFLGRQIILCERREGLSGSVALNEQLRQHVAANLGTKNRTLTPIVATHNNYRLNIFNGDTGLLLETEEDVFAVFLTAEGTIRRIRVAEFTGWETAFALTIHKSQGSEYNDVFVIVGTAAPNADHRLLYTAVTRSRDTATVLKML